MGKNQPSPWKDDVPKEYLGTLRFSEIYNWEIKDIYQFLKDIIEGTKYKDHVRDFEKKKPILQDIYTQLRRLSERLPAGDSGAEDGDGDDFRAGDALKPDQHIRRVFVKDDPDATKEESRFDVVPKDILKLPYWNPWDLLGSFLSILGGAPPTANKGNFFVPLTAVYARWTVKLAEHIKPDGETKQNGDWDIFSPAMYQITWAWHKDRESPPFWIGASFSGCRSDEEYSLGWWELAIKKRRFNMLPLLPQFANEVNNFNINADNTDLSNDKPGEKRSGNRYGCCAEQYVFLHMADQHLLYKEYDFIPPPNSTYFGAAFSREFFTKDEEALTQYKAANMSKQFRKPCRNCTKLLELLNWPLENFAKNPPKGDRPLTGPQPVASTSKKKSSVATNIDPKGETTTLWEHKVTF